MSSPSPGLALLLCLLASIAAIVVGAARAMFDRAQSGRGVSAKLWRGAL
jgi:hypothetical protein